MGRVARWRCKRARALAAGVCLMGTVRPAAAVTLYVTDDGATINNVSVVDTDTAKVVGTVTVPGTSKARGSGAASLRLICFVNCGHLTSLIRGSSQSVRRSTMAAIATNIKPMVSAVPCTIGTSRSTMACTSACPMPG